jgi:hypothetical protein
VRLVDDVGRAGEPADDLRGQLETHVHLPGPKVEQQVTGGRRRGVPRALPLPERVQLGRFRAGEHPVPQLRADAGDAGQLGRRQAEADRPLQPAEVFQKVPGLLLAAGPDGRHQEDRRVGERTQHRL